MAVRLKHHQTSALTVARWLQGRPEIARVLHPALEGDPGHAIWKRDFSGASGLFSIEMNPFSDAKMRTFLDALELFGMGYSWGGFESLIVPCLLGDRTLKPAHSGPMLRLHIGLEDVADLLADLESAFAALKD
jgi:cystathionine beta-lyase